MPGPAEDRLSEIAGRYRTLETEFQAARLELLEAMAKARAEGSTLDRIAAIVGMSRQRVMQLLDRGDG